MDETTVLDEKTEEEVPQEEITSRKSRHSKHNKPKRGKSGDKKGGGRKVRRQTYLPACRARRGRTRGVGVYEKRRRCKL